MRVILMMNKLDNKTVGLLIRVPLILRITRKVSIWRVKWPISKNPVKHNPISINQNTKLPKPIVNKTMIMHPFKLIKHLNI